MAALVEIPIFPLNTVLFPGGRLPLRIFEVRYVDMTKVCIRDAAVFGVCQILEGREAGVPAVAAPIGCTARILEWDVPSPGLFSLVTQGETVFRVIDQQVQRDGLIRAQVLLEEPRTDQPLPEAQRPIGRSLGTLMKKIGMENFPQPARLGDAGWVAYRLAEILPLSTDCRLHLLQERDPLAALAEVERAIRELDR